MIQAQTFKRNTPFEPIAGGISPEWLTYLNDLILWWDELLKQNDYYPHYHFLPPWWNHTGTLILSNTTNDNRRVKWNESHIATKNGIYYLLAVSCLINDFSHTLIRGYYPDIDSLVKMIIVSIAMTALEDKSNEEERQNSRTRYEHRKRKLIYENFRTPAPGWEETHSQLGLFPDALNKIYHNPTTGQWVSARNNDYSGIIATYALTKNFNELNNYLTQLLQLETTTPTPWPPSFETLPYPENIPRPGNQGFYPTENLKVSTLNYAVPQTWTNLPPTPESQPLKPSNPPW